ncbi:AfsR/SARP family transcriptional regulator [Streptomyces sp. enrichment culture]|uniref:AfsR/SARP family transcriptional regulator n=1 Tax=Streptomyces sp. enrichment culture TaxID=1795815 RepID=UPI003F55487C
MQFLVLGPLELTEEGGRTAVSAPRLQQLLVVLLMARGSVLPLSAISAELWPAGPPSTADTTIRTYVHELRKLLPAGAGRLSTEGAGYRLAVPWQDVDALSFEDRVGTARSLLRDSPPIRPPHPAPDRPVRPPHPVPAPRTEPLRHTAALLTEALGLWRGPAFAGVPTGPHLDMHLADLNAQWLRAMQLRIHVDLLLGRHRELIGELKSLVGEFPLEDRFTAQLMVALHRSGRRGEALRAYQTHQHRIRAELGTAPAPRLTRLRNRVLSAQCATPVETLLH